MFTLEKIVFCINLDMGALTAFIQLGIYSQIDAVRVSVQRFKSCNSIFSELFLSFCTFRLPYFCLFCYFMLQFYIISSNIIYFFLSSCIMMLYIIQQKCIDYHCVLLNSSSFLNMHGVTFHTSIIILFQKIVLGIYIYEQLINTCVLLHLSSFLSIHDVILHTSISMLFQKNSSRNIYLWTTFKYYIILYSFLKM